MTSPTRCASAASIGSPERIISIARPSGTARGSRTVPPAPGMIAHFVSASPKVALSEHTRMSHASAISSPPASACPLTAAIRGLARSVAVNPPKFQGGSSPARTRSR